LALELRYTTKDIIYNFDPSILYKLEFVEDLVENMEHYSVNFKYGVGSNGELTQFTLRDIGEETREMMNVGEYSKPRKDPKDYKPYKCDEEKDKMELVIEAYESGLGFLTVNWKNISSKDMCKRRNNYDKLMVRFDGSIF
jgi:hypothetical protein